jgi:predicted permease
VELEPVRHSGFRIVGVMPRGFLFPTEGADVRFITPYVLQGEDKTNPRRRGFFEVIARVPKTVGAGILQERIEAAMAEAAATFPSLGPKPAGRSDRSWRQQGPFDDARVEPLSVSLGSRSRPLFGAILLAVSILVGLGAINASGLVAARTLDRAREVGVRRALGASRTAIARMVFLEVATLVGAGSLLGLLFVAPLLHLALSLLPEEVVLLKPAQIDWRVTAFVVVGALILSVPAAVWPIRRALRAGWTGIADGGRTAPRSRSAGQFIVVAVQVAGAFVLTVGGTLLVGSILAVYAHVRPIRTDGVVVIETMVQDAFMNHKSPGRAARVDTILDRLRHVPGVVAIGVTEAEVLRGGNWPSWFTPPAGANRKLMVDLQAVAGDYFRVLQPQLVAGRLPTDAELAGNARVIVVSEGVARAYWPLGSPIGQVLTQEGEADPYAVIGVVKDVRWFSWDQPASSIYGPLALLSRYPMMTFMIQTGGNSARVVASALGAIADADPLVKPMRAATLDDLFVDSVRSRRFRSWLFGTFAAAGLIVVGVGILGLLAMSTARRTREMGIRSALGATRGRITALLLREQLSPVLAGLIAGGFLAVWTATLVKSHLYEVTMGDSRVWIMAVALLVLTALLGALLPAIQAGRTDPAHALRAE